MILKVKYLLRLLSDFIIVTFLLALSLNISKIWGPIKKHGFVCGDTSLIYPLHRDTVTYVWLYGIGLGIPVVMIVALALVENFVLNSRPSKNLLRSWLMIHVSLLPFLFGFAAERLLKEIGKFAVGRLRPYFFAVCQPVLADGTGCEWEENQGKYIEHYSCQGAANADNISHLINYAMRTSFPSGHASLTVYAMTFVVFYLQRFGRSLRLYRCSFGLFVPFLQFAAVLWAWFVAISRVTDYKHHASDVLAGSLLGLGVGIAVCRHVHGHLKGGRAFLEAINMPKKSPVVRRNESVQEQEPQQQQQPQQQQTQQQQHQPQQQQEHSEPVGESVASTYVTPATSLSEVPSNVTEVQVQP
ncbi:phospholipid phosphatase 1-like [Musca domestica]|uniref:Phospholipid phosphatase 1-like n=1 Tax=Musca domestica TaxID=7370 RepID=A0ABM3UP83_MUSDO|nr:phospholipid phosphatase 1-like [Musca domestica]